MRILIIGAAGMIGRKLTERLISQAQLNGTPLSHVQLVDVIEPEFRSGEPSPLTVETSVADVSMPATASNLLANRPDIIFHLAAIVSGEAEADMQKGYTINLDGTRFLFDAVRQLHDADGYCPRVIFASSIAVFGAPLPEVIDDDHLLAPLTSYGTQKAIGELLLADYTRRGIFDGIGLRLPTICIRPGKPNLAASGFFSNILREPLHGKPAVLPVAESVQHWFASPRTAIDYLVHAATLDGERVGHRRNLSLPGLSATVGEQIEALERTAGTAASGLIQRQPDEGIRRIINSWPKAFDSARAIDLGFVAETSFDDIIQVYIDDEM